MAPRNDMIAIWYKIRANGDSLMPGKALMVGERPGAGTATLRTDLARGGLFLGEAYIRIV